MANVTPNLRLNVPDYAQSGWDTLLNANLNIIDSLLNRAAGLTLYAGIYAQNTSYVLNQTVTDPADNRLWQTNLGYTTTLGNTFAQERAAIPGRWTDVTSSIASAASAAATAAGSATAAQTASTNAGNSATAAAASALAAANSAGSLASSGGATKNAIVNGNMVINQRTGPYVVAAASPAWTLDRWKASHGGTGGTTTVSQVSATSSILLDIGLSSALNYNVTVAATSQGFRQLQSQIEDARTFSGRTVTVSFWAWVASGTLSVNALLTQNFGTGGSPSSGVNTASFPFTITTTPTLFTFTVLLASISGKTFGSNNDSCLILTYNMPLTGTYSFNLTGVQMELGTGATAFAYRPVMQELALCQRYYQVGGATFYNYTPTAGGFLYQPHPMPVVMRIAPTIVLTPSGGTNYSTASYTNVRTDSITVSAVSSAVGAVSFNYVFTAVAEIQ